MESKLTTVLKFPKRHWRGFSVSLAVLACFLFLPGWLLVDNVIGAGSAISLQNPTTLGPPRDNYFGKPLDIYPAPNSDFCVAFEFFGLDQTNSYVHLRILMAATENGANLIPRNPDHQTGSLIFTTEAGLSDYSVSFPLTQSLKDYPVNCDSMLNPKYLDKHATIRLDQQSLFVLGSPRAFPNDWYELDDQVSVMVAGMNRPSSIIMTSRDEDFSLTASVYKPHDSTPARRLMFIIDRPWLVVFYTYFVAVMPLALLVGIFSLIYRHKVRGQEVSERWVPGITDVAFGVAATMVAILPLRMVLVPNSLPGLTRLDILFGIEITFLVAASLLWIEGTSRWKASSQHEDDK
jgi:hypothetical protein